MDLAREPNFRLGGIEVRPSTRELVFEGGREVLEPRVMAVLVTLARAKGEVVTRDDLTAACWDSRVVSDDAINRVISRIRRASDLTQGRDFTLETITKVGYRLVGQAGAAVAPVAEGPPAKRRTILPVAILAVLAVMIATGAWWLAGRKPEWTPDPTKSLILAVLPFDNLGPTPEDAPLAIGMAREIRNTLSRVRGLRVVSDSASFAAADGATPEAEIGQKLKASLLVDGSFTRTGDTVKLSVELVDPWKGVNLWTGSTSGPAADLDHLRQQMSAQVFEQIVARVGPNRLEMLAPPKARDPRAYRLLMEAQQLLQSTVAGRMRGRPQEGLDAGDKADALIEHALAIEPEHPLALRLKAQLVSMGGTRALFGKGTQMSKAADSAAYLRRAIASDPDAVPALAALGEYYRRFEWRWEDARALFERALALDPNNPDANLSYSYYLSAVGRCQEALERSQLAIEIDPTFGWRTLGAPRALKCLGRYEESDEAYRGALRQDPGSLFVLREAYFSFLERGDAEGLEKLRQFVRDDLWKGKVEGDVNLWLEWTNIAIRALKGDKAPFMGIIARDMAASDIVETPQPLSERDQGKGDVLWLLAIEFAVADEPERAINMLERAIAAGALYVPETMPFGAYEFTPEVRASKRYQAIWKNDPRLVELMKLRQQSVEAGLMDGVLPNGQRSTPKPPAPKQGV